PRMKSAFSTLALQLPRLPTPGPSRKREGRRIGAKYQATVCSGRNIATRSQANGFPDQPGHAHKRHEHAHSPKPSEDESGKHQSQGEPSVAGERADRKEQGSGKKTINEPAKAPHIIVKEAAFRILDDPEAPLLKRYQGVPAGPNQMTRKRHVERYGRSFA